jgi:hypothetical protein
MMTANMKTKTNDSNAYRADFIRKVVDGYLTKREKTAKEQRLRETTVVVTDFHGEIPQSEGNCLQPDTPADREKISDRGPSTPSL